MCAHNLRNEVTAANVRMSLCLAVLREFLINKEHQTYVRSDMQQIRNKPLVESPSAFIPPSAADAVPGSLVVMVLVLQPRPHHLVRVRQRSCHQLRTSCKRQVFRRALEYNKFT